METVYHVLAPPSPCGYLPDQTWRLEYELVAAMTPTEYMERMERGWRRFGNTLFRPRCPACSACRSLRVIVDRFRPNRSQRRAGAANDGVVRLEIGRPQLTQAKLDLYHRYHLFQAEHKGWPWPTLDDRQHYFESFIDNPFPTQEWCYYLGRRLVGVGYVDDLPAGLSAIYFFYDPAERSRSLGTWNVLSILRKAAEQRLPHVYLGYYVEGCPSMHYKSRFVPNQVLDPDGQWRDYVTEHSRP
ncbi:MAG: arginyltransferase [Gemmataceae bacterium]|nr:arginyltransferase [Gemmataceae bacterium]MDW8265655.1 arginyltransferase [Gemmataceae bacterium]